MNKKIISIIKESSGVNAFYVNWMLHDKCTYNCSYCPPSNKAGNDDWLSLDLSKRFIDNLENWLIRTQNKIPVVIQFTGGEPTVWSDFAALCEYIKSKGWYLTMTTNGSRSLRWWKEHASKFELISISYHSEFVDDNEYLDKIIFLTESKNNIHTNIMMNPIPQYWDRCVQIIDKIIELKIKTSVRPLQPNFGLVEIPILPYTLAQLEFINEKNIEIKSISDPSTDAKRMKPARYIANFNDGSSSRAVANELVLEKMVNFNGWTCWAGLENIFINSLGKIYRGTCMQGNRIGSILDPDNIIWPSDPIICQSSWCGCYTDILLTKKETDETIY